MHDRKWDPPSHDLLRPPSSGLFADGRNSDLLTDSATLTAEHREKILETLARFPNRVESLRVDHRRFRRLRQVMRNCPSASEAFIDEALKNCVESLKVSKTLLLPYFTFAVSGTRCSRGAVVWVESTYEIDVFNS